MIAKFVNGRQNNWDIYLPAFLYAYRMSPHKSTGHTPYKAMLGRAPPSKDRAATELIPMDEWVQELRTAQEEARKLILANIKSEQQDRVESTPHWLRTWEAGNQVMLQADRRGKGRSKKLSKKRTCPTPSFRYAALKWWFLLSTRSSGLATPTVTWGNFGYPR